MIPFTYFLYHRPTGLRYYGCRYSKLARPDTLWKTYFTSSKVIKELIARYGKNSFDVQVRVVCKSKEQALAIEERVLRKFNTNNDSTWANQAIGPKIKCFERTPEHQAKISHANTGKKRSPEHCDKMSKIFKGRILGKRPASVGEAITKAKAKTWTLLDPTGNSITVTNMQQFCKDNGLSKSSMSLVLQGRRLKSHKGYRAIGPS